MHLHEVTVHHIALILATVAIMCEVSWASTQHKRVMMDGHMKNNRPGARIKRSMERFDLQKYNEKSKIQKAFNYLNTNDDDSAAFYKVPQKRQLSSLNFGEIALPIVTEAINGFAKARGSFLTESGNVIPNIIGRAFGQSEDNPPSFDLLGNIAPFFSSVSSPLKSMLPSMKPASSRPGLTLPFV